jgi:hypothetical protein
VTEKVEKLWPQGLVLHYIPSEVVIKVDCVYWTMTSPYFSDLVPWNAYDLS